MYYYMTVFFSLWSIKSKRNRTKLKEKKLQTHSTKELDIVMICMIVCILLT